MRELTELEKRICEKQINKLRRELSHTEWLLKYNQLMIDEGLERNYEEKKREFKLQHQQLIGEIANVHEKIRILLEQIKNGVDAKDEMVEMKGGVDYIN